MMYVKNILIIFITVFLISCGATGRNFSSGYVQHIENGKTTKLELVQELGEPNRKGMTDGDDWWIYEYNTYKFGKNYSKDLGIRFNEKGLVKAFNFSSNFPEEGN